MDRHLPASLFVVAGIGYVDAGRLFAWADGDLLPVDILGVPDRDGGVEIAGGVDGVERGVVAAIGYHPEDSRVGWAGCHPARFRESFLAEPTDQLELLGPDPTPDRLFQRRGA